MGYDLHITRRAHWSGEGDDISVEEWLALVATDPELHLQTANGPYVALWSRPALGDHHWLAWSNGQIHTKNPDDALVGKMVEIARKLDAKVQGDDGEIYRHSAHRPRIARISAFKQFLRRLHGLYSRSFGQPKLPPPPFKVGDRVISTGGELATVKSIHRRAGHGYGELQVVMDNGQERTYALFAHGFSKVEGD